MLVDPFQSHAAGSAPCALLQEVEGNGELFSGEVTRLMKLDCRIVGLRPDGQAAAVSAEHHRRKGATRCTTQATAENGPDLPGHETSDGYQSWSPGLKKRDRMRSHGGGCSGPLWEDSDVAFGVGLVPINYKRLALVGSAGQWHEVEASNCGDAFAGFLTDFTIELALVHW